MNASPLLLSALLLSPALAQVTADAQGAVANTPGYAAVFRAGEVRFRASEASEDLALRLDSVWRGDALAFDPAALASKPLVERGVEGDVVRIAWPGFEEVYDVRDHGLKQSFVFRTPPVGAGDLSVRLTVETAMQARADDAGGVLFESEDGGLVRVGAVVGLDAAGRHVDGTLNLDGDRLELVLPHDFVETAAYPLVLDPLISDLRPSNSITGDRYVDVAWDRETHRYALVWERPFSDGSAGYYMQVFEEDGSIYYPSHRLGKSDVAGCPPSVCSQDGLFISAHREVSAGSEAVKLTAMQASVLYSSGYATFPTPGLIDLDIGGDGAGYGLVCLVWSDASGIRSQLFSVEFFFLLEPASEVLTLGDGLPEANRLPRISQSNGPAGNWLVVWETTQFGTTEIAAVAVDRWGSVGDVVTWGEGATAPSCDGNGKRFLVVHVGVGGEHVMGRILHVEGGLRLVPYWFGPLASGEGHEVLSPQVAITSLGLDQAWSVTWLWDVGGTPFLPSDKLMLQSFDDALNPRYLPEEVSDYVKDARIASLYSTNFFDLGYKTIAIGMATTSAVFHALGES